MWMAITRAPKLDKPYWPGRRIAALADALVWPMLVAAGLLKFQQTTGLTGPFAVAVCVFFAARRATIALWRNWRYRFTTVWVGTPLLAILALGAILKFAA